MQVEVYFDVLCPWCYIGHRRLATALAGRDAPVVVWRSLELAPDGDRVPGETAAEVIARYAGSTEQAAERLKLIESNGAAEGLRLDLHRARPVNSFDAHRLVKLAAAHRRVDEVLELLLHGYHTEGLNIADASVLQRLGTEAGLDPSEVHRVLSGTEFAADVRADERRAAAHGIRGVPTLVVDGGPPASLIQDPAALARLLSTPSATPQGSQ
ncbi:DsbA family oxidoreductase [Streptomyces sp. NPDC127068]|uniref:DsbA family oxidoreductase n=1 Tax=Streptomyces sp. NPDC127068 TaxID=3347127 RepID=UPI00365F985C